MKLADYCGYNEGIYKVHEELIRKKLSPSKISRDNLCLAENVANEIHKPELVKEIIIEQIRKSNNSTDEQDKIYLKNLQKHYSTHVIACAIKATTKNKNEQKEKKTNLRLGGAYLEKLGLFSLEGVKEYHKKVQETSPQKYFNAQGKEVEVTVVDISNNRFGTFPREIFSIFPHVDLIFAKNNQIQKITNRDFHSMPHGLTLKLDDNPIEKIEEKTWIQKIIGRGPTGCSIYFPKNLPPKQVENLKNLTALSLVQKCHNQVLEFAIKNQDQIIFLAGFGCVTTGSYMAFYPFMQQKPNPLALMAMAAICYQGGFALGKFTSKNHHSIKNFLQGKRCKENTIYPA